MAFSGGYLTGSETTQREALLGEIVVRSPAETPLLATLPSFTMKNRVTEWSLDRPYTSSDAVRNIGAPHGNSRAEGAEFTTRTAHYAVRPRCIAEIQHFGMQITRTDMRAIVAGVDDTFDYRAAQLSTTLMNNMENTLMYGQGNPETDGSSAPPAGNLRQTQGLLFNSAWTGLERMSGSSLDAITDPYGISIPSDFWSVFYDANRSPLSRRMLYNKLLATILRAGGRLDIPWIFHVGYKTMALVADFLMDPAGNNINERNIGAAEAGGYDYIAWMKFPSGHRVGFRTNRYLDVEGSTFSVDNSPASPVSASPGGISTTFQGDQTIIGYEPGSVSIGYIDAPHFVNVPVTGDYAQLQAVSEFALRVKSPLCVAGIGNCGQ